MGIAALASSSAFHACVNWNAVTLPNVPHSGAISNGYSWLSFCAPPYESVIGVSEWAMPIARCV